MARRIHPSWTVFASYENAEHDRSVDLFCRPRPGGPQVGSPGAEPPDGSGGVDESFGFEEFRRDVEDRGVWTPVAFYSGRSFATREEALSAARHTVPWLREALGG